MNATGRISLALRLVAIVIMFSITSPGIVPAEEGISLSKSALDFGRVALGATVTQTVSLANHTGAALRIERINWTCGCIQGTMQSQEIAAHSEAELRVRARPTQPGKRAGTLFVYDSLGQSHQLQVTVEGIPAIAAKPDVLQFGAVIHGAGAEKPLAIQFSAPKAYTIDRLHFDPKLFDIETLPDTNVQSERERRLNIRVRKDAPLGEFRESLALYLRHEEEATACVVLLTGRVTHELFVTPASIRLQAGSGHGTISRSVILRSATGREFEVTSLATDNSAASAKIRVLRKNVAIIDITIAKGALTDLPQTATLEIETNLAAQPRLIVPIEITQ